MKKIFIVIALLGLTGCTHYSYTAPDGTKAEATSWGPKEIQDLHTHFADGKGAERSLDVGSYTSKEATALYGMLGKMAMEAVAAAAKGGSL